VLWQGEAQKAKWAMMARVYSFVRDSVGKKAAPMGEFLGYAAAALDIVPADMYLAANGWAFQGAELARAGPVPVAAEVAMGEADLLAECIRRGYKVAGGGDLVAQLTRSMQGVMTVGEGKAAGGSKKVTFGAVQQVRIISGGQGMAGLVQRGKDISTFGGQDIAGPVQTSISTTNISTHGGQDIVGTAQQTNISHGQVTASNLVQQGSISTGGQDIAGMVQQINISHGGQVTAGNLDQQMNTSAGGQGIAGNIQQETNILAGRQGIADNIDQTNTSTDGTRGTAGNQMQGTNISTGGQAIAGNTQQGTNISNVPQVGNSVQQTNISNVLVANPVQQTNVSNASVANAVQGTNTSTNIPKAIKPGDVATARFAAEIKGNPHAAALRIFGLAPGDNVPYDVGVFVVPTAAYNCDVGGREEFDRGQTFTDQLNGPDDANFMGRSFVSCHDRGD